MTTTSSRLALLAVIILAWFEVFELSLRVAGGSEAGPGFRDLFTPDPAIGYRLRPSTSIRFTTSEFSSDIAINSAGVRDNEVGPKTPGERRIVVLGDSLVLAVQVPLQQTFCKQLERRLNARANPAHYRVINAGVQGYGPVEEALFYERVASRLQPDLVLVVVFVANDAVEAVDAAFRLVGNGAPARSIPPVQALHDRLRRAVRRSIVLQIVNQRWIQLREGARGGRPALPDRRLLSYATPLPADIARGFDVSREAIARVAADVAATGGRTGIVLMPARFQVDHEEYERLRAVVEPAGYRISVDSASDRFRSALAPLGLPTLDLLPALRSESRSRDEFFTSTAHLTPIGHQVVADALLSFLDQAHLTP
jgi:lysophospholipase L1-like esterase